MVDNRNESEDLPGIVGDYIDSVIRKMRYRRKVRRQVRGELTAHFCDALANCETTEKQEQRAKELIPEFGDTRLLAKLIRRSKKRCRPLWRTVVVRCLQIVGILILFTGLRIGHLSFGRPSIKVDYTVWLNELVRGGKDEALNAKIYFDKAAELMPDEMPEFWEDCDDPDWIEEASEEQRQAIVEFLDANAEKKIIDGTHFLCYVLF